MQRIHEPLTPITDLREHLSPNSKQAVQEKPNAQKDSHIKEKTGNPGVHPISSRKGSPGCNNRYPIFALTDANYFNGTPIRQYHESISASCNGSYLHGDGEQWEQIGRLKTWAG